MATSIPDCLNSFTETWSPRLVGRINDHEMKIAKIDGPFIFHSHPDTDECFYLLSGSLTMEIEGGEDIVMRPGDVYTVPKGIRHKPVADKAEIMMIEKRGTVNTGDEPENERTKAPVDVTA